MNLKPLFCFKHEWVIRETKGVERELLLYPYFKKCKKCGRWKYTFKGE